MCSQGTPSKCGPLARGAAEHHGAAHLSQDVRSLELHSDILPLPAPPERTPPGSHLADPGGETICGSGSGWVTWQQAAVNWYEVVQVQVFHSVS